jgi:hypothetical protein
VRRTPLKRDENSDYNSHDQDDGDDQPIGLSLSDGG